MLALAKREQNANSGAERSPLRSGTNDRVDPFRTP